MPTETDDYEDNLCPMCLEELDITDRNFKPCQCGYQMCRFCWHHIKENLNGRCPACRSLYDAENYEFTPPDPLELAKIEKQKKDRDKLRKNQEANARKHLSNVRVIQRNLVYVTNLSVNAAREDILKKNDFFGQYGKIVKAVINRNNFYNSNNPQGPSVSAYALTAIQAVDGAVVEGRVLRASFGTTKYCSFFLRNLPCTNPECMYLHELGGDRDSFTKEDMALGKHHIHETLPATVAPPAASKLGPKKSILPPPGTRSSSVNKPLAVSSDKITIITSTRGWNVPISTSPPALNPEEWPTTLDAVNYHHVASTSPPPSYVRALSSSAPIVNHTKPAAPPAPPVSALPATASWGAKSKMENPPPTSPRATLTSSSNSTPPTTTSPIPTPIPSPTPVIDPVVAAAVASGISRKNSAPAVTSVPAKKEASGQATKKDVPEVTDKSDKAEPKLVQTASEGKPEVKADAKADSKTEGKAEPKAEPKVAKSESLEPKSEPKLDLKSEKPAEVKDIKTETKSKKKIKKEVSFDTSTAPVETHASLSTSKPIGPPPGFKIDAAKQLNKKSTTIDGGSSSSSETEGIVSRNSDRSSLTSSSETSAWNYGLKRSSDIAPPPGWNPPGLADSWSKIASQPAKATDMPEIEQFDPWAENTALGIVDLILKDNTEEASGAAAAKAAAQLHPNLPHLQNQTPPTFAVPSIPPPDFHHWQTQITPTRTQRSRFDFAQEEEDPSTSTNGINLASAFPLVDPGIVAAKPASKSSALDFEGQGRTTGILPTPNLLAPYSLPPPGLMPLAPPEDWQRSFQALLPNVKISFASMPQGTQGGQAWDSTQESLNSELGNQKAERRLSQPTLPQSQQPAQSQNQLSQSQPQVQQTQQSKTGKGGKQNSQQLQQLQQQQQLQIQQHQLQIQQHHQQQQLQQHLQQQLQHQQLLQHQHQQLQQQQLQQLQQQQLHLQQHQLQQLQQRQQQIHQLQLQQQLQQLQQLQDNKAPMPTSPRADENNDWFNHNEASYKHILQQKKPDQDKSKKGGLDSSDGAMDTMPKGKAGSRPPGFPASSQPQQPSPPLAQQPALLPPPANLPFRDPAILGAGMAYMVPSNEEHHWGYRGPPPFPLQPPHHQPPHMRGMGLVSILTPPPRNPMQAPFAFAPNAANGAATSPPMMFAPNDILVPGAGILGPHPGIATVNTAINNSSASTPSPPSNTTDATPQPKLSKTAKKRLKQQQQLLQQQQTQTPLTTAPTSTPTPPENATLTHDPNTPQTQTNLNTQTDTQPITTGSSAKKTKKASTSAPSPSPASVPSAPSNKMENPNINNQERDIEIEPSPSPTSSSSEREASNDNESVESTEEKRKAKKKKKAKSKDKKEQQKAEAAKKKAADKENNPKKQQQQQQTTQPTQQQQPQTQPQPQPQQQQQQQKQPQPQPQPLPLPLPLSQVQPPNKQPQQQFQPTTTQQLPSFYPIQKLPKKDTTITTDYLHPASIANLSIGDVNIKFRNEMTLSGDEIGFTVEVGGVGSSAVVETLEKEVANAKKELREWEEKLQQVKMRNGIF